MKTCVYIEPDDVGVIAKIVGLPLYGVGDDIFDAIEMLKREVESLHEDLAEDDNLTEKWSNIFEFLKKLLLNEESIGRTKS